MEGVSHPWFRDLMAARPGLGMVCTEFVRITAEPFNPNKLAAEVRKSPGVPLSVQVMGRDLERMAEAATAVSAAGADVVDINLGCPSRNAVRAGVGSAMLKEPEVLRQVVRVMRQRTPGLLSAKIRAGFDDSAGVLRLAEIVQEAGADYLVVHPRRRVDFYEGVADWRIVRLLAASLDIPVVGNGDVWYAVDALRLEQEAGCAGVMLGRPAMRNPWVFEQIDCLRRGVTPPKPTGEDLYAWVAALGPIYEPVFKHGALGRVKELVTYLGRAIADGGELRKLALRAQTFEELLRIFEPVRRMPASVLDLGAEGELGLEKSARAA